MKIETAGAMMIGRMDDVKFPEKDRKKLEAMANEDTAEELAELLDEAEKLADPVILFGVCSAKSDNGQTVWVNGVEVNSALAAEKLSGRNRCFPYVATCGKSLEEWSKQYADDLLTEYWADEIKKYYVGSMRLAFYNYLKELFHITGHLTSLNPGSITAWPLSGQAELFAVLGGKAFVEETIGVTYTESYLMLPSKSVSGIAFESEVFYENCQFCPLKNCPGRRAKQVEE